MSYYRISDLPNLNGEELVDGNEFAVRDNKDVIRRVNISENVIETERQAIERVIEIYRTGRKAFILPYKE